MAGVAEASLCWENCLVRCVMVWIKSITFEMLWQSELFHPRISYRTFNPADYAEPASTDENYGNSNNNTWNNTGSFEPDDGTSKCLCMRVCWFVLRAWVDFASIQLQWGHSRQVLGSGMEEWVVGSEMDFSDPDTLHPLHIGNGSWMTALGWAYGCCCPAEAQEHSPLFVFL